MSIWDAIHVKDWYFAITNVLLRSIWSDHTNVRHHKEELDYVVKVQLVNIIADQSHDDHLSVITRRIWQWYHVTWLKSLSLREMKIDKKKKRISSLDHNWAIIFFAETYTTPNTFWMLVDIGSRWLKMCGFDVRIWMLCLKKRWAFSTRHFATLRNRSSKISSVFWGRSCWVVIHALNSWSFASISSAGIVSMLLTDSLSFAVAVRLRLNLKCRKKAENAHTRVAVAEISPT